MVLRGAWTRAREAGSARSRKLTAAAVRVRVPAAAAIWSRTLATAAGVAVFAGAGQFGLAYGFGLLRPGDPGRDLAWPTHLTWIVWFAILAVLAGAAASTATAGRAARPLTFAGRIAAAASAGAGAVVVLPLAAWPARAVTLDGRDAALEAGISAGLGVVIGFLAALAALTFREVAVSLITVVAVGWALALISVAPALDLAATTPPVRLAVLDLPSIPDGARFAMGALGPLLIAVAAGVVTAARTRRREPSPTLPDGGFWPHPRTLAAIPVGGALLAVTYLVAGPGSGLGSAPQVAPYAGSLAAAGAGLLAVLVTAAIHGQWLAHLAPGWRRLRRHLPGRSAPARHAAHEEPTPPTSFEATQPLAGAQADAPLPEPTTPDGAEEAPSASPPPVPAARHPREAHSEGEGSTDTATAAETSDETAPLEPTEPTIEAAARVSDPGRGVKHRAGKSKRDSSGVRPGEEDYLNWVAALGSEDDSADPASGRRRLRRDPPTTPPAT